MLPLHGAPSQAPPVETQARAQEQSSDAFPKCQSAPREAPDRGGAVQKPAKEIPLTHKILINAVKNHPYPGRGVDLGISEDCIEIYNLTNKGDFHDWNIEHEEFKVKEKDRIVEVNGFKGIMQMLNELNKKKALLITIARGGPSDVRKIQCKGRRKKATKASQQSAGGGSCIYWAEE